ncbi:hypothetical protein ILP92_18075 [Maribius pontilimi]|uniref:TolB amino-terminal domain-containing protein n=1 Tax=Palleronia pontilimi TaxID=1964209 RepID=A0A934MIW7_9RHOB|nr:hypothetical protein [Palleronia pontilimi]MBJ3764644.1 hypothetical protein [Palleronia pontilimi]
MLKIHLSGAFRIGGPAIPDTLSRRGQALLAFLAAQPGLRAERARLADLLWTDRAAGQARASLRQELSVLRRALPESTLLSDRRAVWLDEDKVQVVRDGATPFLDGFDLASEGFEDWLREMRQLEPTSQTAATTAQGGAQAFARRNRPSLAILPFDEFGAREADMFADGVVSEITSALSRVREFHVIARQSAFALRGEVLDIAAIGTRLGADYVVEGSIQRQGERVRLSVELVEAATGRTLWAEQFDDRLDDLFDLQDRISMHVAGQLAPSLRAAEIARAHRRPKADRTAYELVLSALPHIWAHRAEETGLAIAHLDQALEVQPDYGPALAYKAWCHANQRAYLWSRDPAGDFEAACAALDRAEPLVQDDPAALTALSAAAALGPEDGERAIALSRRALALDPNNAWGWMRQGWNEVYLRQPQAALASFDRADALSPLDPFRFNFMFGRSAALRLLDRHDEAIDLIKLGLRAGPGVVWAYRMLFATCWLAGYHDEAMEAGRKWRAAYPIMTPELLDELLPKWMFDQRWRTVMMQILREDPVPPGSGLPHGRGRPGAI